MSIKTILAALVSVMGMTSVLLADTLQEGLVRIPAYYSAEDPNDANVPKFPASMYYIFDGDLQSGRTPENISAVYVLDLGQPRTVKQVAIGLNSNGSAPNWAKGFWVSGSNDRETWTDLFKHDGVAQPLAVSSWNYFTLPEPAAYRYVKFHKFASGAGCISEAAVYGDEDVYVTADKPMVFDLSKLGESAEKSSIALSGKLVNMPSGTAQLVAFAAKEDYGYDYADWSANCEQKVILSKAGEVADIAAGETATGAFTGLDEGRHFWRIFAVADGKTFVAPPVDQSILSVGTTATIGDEQRIPVAYVTGSSIEASYNGNPSDFSGRDASSMVLDLGEDMGDQHLELIRLFPYPDNPTTSSRARGGSVAFGFSEGEAIWSGATPLAIAGVNGKVRTVYKVDSLSPTGIRWVENMQPFVYDIPHLSGNAVVTFTCDTVGAKPRYVKVNIDSFHVAEIELRFAKDPDNFANMTVASSPMECGTPSHPYGTGKITVDGQAKTVTMPQREIESADLVTSLKGWTLRRVDAEGNETLTTSTAETIDTCTFTPVIGETITLTWNWSVEARIPAKIYPVRNKEDVECARGDAPIWNVEDGDIGSWPAGDNNDFTAMKWDMGAVRKISWIKAAPRNNNSVLNRTKDLKAWGSVDGRTWEVFYDREGTPFPLGWSRIDFETPKEYRYVCVDCGASFNVSEWQMFSSDLMLSTDTPCAWPTDGQGRAVVASAEPANGVKVSGKLVNSPNGPATIRIYAAAKDYDEDIEAWRQNAVASATIERVTGGSSFETRLSGLAKTGRCYWRVFAECDGQVTASTPCIPFYAGTEKFRPQAYCSGANVGGVYDGSNYNMTDAAGWMVFDLRTIPAGYRLAAVRIWPRSLDDGYMRVAAGTVKFGYAESGKTVDWAVSQTIRDSTSDSPLAVVPSATPDGVTWGEMSEVGRSIFDYMRRNVMTTDYVVDGRTHVLKPDYLYFTVPNMNAYEVELRIAKIYMKGLVITIH